MFAGSGSLAWHLADVWETRKTVQRTLPSTSVAGLITEVETYRDVDFDFHLDVPAGWTPTVAFPDEDGIDYGLVIPHTVSFEAPRENEADVFSDYVMVEIIPGSHSGQFITDGSRAIEVMIDGLSGKRESLAIDEHVIEGETLDLIVHQAEIRATGYSVGFFAIGEPKNRQLLDDAFELMIRSFQFSVPPYRVI